MVTLLSSLSLGCLACGLIFSGFHFPTPWAEAVCSPLVFKALHPGPFFRLQSELGKDNKGWRKPSSLPFPLGPLALPLLQHNEFLGQFSHINFSLVLLQKIRSKALNCLTIGSHQHTNSEIISSDSNSKCYHFISNLFHAEHCARGSAEIFTSIFTHSYSNIRIVALATHHLRWKSTHLSMHTSKH